MEQITLTKEELKEIVAREVREAINGKKPVRASSIFNDVSLDGQDFYRIHRRFSYTKSIDEGRFGRLTTPLSLKKYLHGLDRQGRENYEHYKVYSSQVHDHIRKLTLSAFGVTLNSDLSEAEYSQAAEMYNAIKEYYLHLYKNRLSRLTINDFE